MKVFISVDIEGIATTTTFDECEISNPIYKAHSEQMTKETIAACEAARAAGADEVFVRDAHHYAINIDQQQLPEYVTTIRGWNGHPYSMVYGIDKSFDAAMFIGYHSAASRKGNPMSHTNNPNNIYIKLNGEFCSEFTLFSYACALEGVPSVFLAGDKDLCEVSKNLHPNLVTCPVKDGLGGITVNYNPSLAIKQIRKLAEQALKQDLKNALTTLPKHFTLEVCYKEQKTAESMSHYPGIIKADDNILRFESSDFYEVLRAIKFIN
ncbi:MAG: M55 family metallopeptidase [Defluviitaleaceae bacterium]|nr:M55 family metallopeptidase [Defluviitaleaceae bacterium]